MKINISIDDDLMKRVDKYCDAFYLTRSGFFTQCAIEKINALESIDTLKQITDVLAVIKGDNSQEIDEDTKKEIENLVYLSDKLLKVANK